MQLRCIFFPNMQSFIFSKGEAMKAMKESDKHASFTSGEGFFCCFLKLQS